jgi:hypothetical protein
VARQDTRRAQRDGGAHAEREREGHAGHGDGQGRAAHAAERGRVQLQADQEQEEEQAHVGQRVQHGQVLQWEHCCGRPCSDRAPTGPGGCRPIYIRALTSSMNS